MNVADLLQDAPSDGRRQPHREQQPQPPQIQHREPSPERPPSRQQQHPPPQPHPRSHPSHSPYPPSQQQPSRNARPLSPPREYPREYPGNHPPSQRLPPPSAIMDFAEPFDKHRRPGLDALPPPPLPHDMAMRQQHGPPMGAPGPHAYGDHRPPPGPSSRSQPPPSHPHSHHHGHPSGPSPMYMPPMNSRNAMPPSKLGPSPSGPGMPPPMGHGSIPLFPTPVGPGVAPHMDNHRDPRGPPSFNEQSPMYSGPPNSMGRPLSSQGSLGHPHDHRIVSRHRRTSSGGHGSQANSPAMGSLQRPPYDERDGGRGPYGGPPSHFGGGIGSGTTTPVGRADHRSASMSRGPPQMLTGPGAAGMHDESMVFKERFDREQERERDREREGRMMERREREREREMREREMMDREMYERDLKAQRAWERERREEEKMREREREMREGPDMMIGMLGNDRHPGGERDREYQHQRKIIPKEQPDHFGSHMPSRYAEPRRPMESESQQERDMLIAREGEDRRARHEMERIEDMNRHAQLGRMGVRERDARVKERAGEIDRGSRKERREPKRVSDEHGWLLESRAPEGWPKDYDREREKERERERIMAQELREREEIELRRVHPRHDHVHNHHRHPPTQVAPNAPPHATSSKPSKLSKPPEHSELGPPVGPGALPPPFGSIVVERPPYIGRKHPLTKVPIGAAPGQSPLLHPPQHLHPSQNMHLPHPHAPPFSHRPPTPPPMNALTAPGIIPSIPSKSPRPPLLPTLPPRHLGTFVYPRVPFPFFDFASPLPDPAATSPSSGTIPEKEIREIHVTIHIPTGFLPTTPPKRPRIWGGAPIPSFNPLFATPQLLHHLQSGMSSYGFPRPHPYELHGMRRVYTDDSDLFLCALHAGWVSWSATRRARREGKDLRLELRLTKEPRYVGGLGAKYVGTPEGQDGLGDDDGSSLLSAGWGNSHDGSGMEILNAEFVKKGTARKLGLPNRDQRLAEYSECSAKLGCMSPARKRRRINAMSNEDYEDFTVTPSEDVGLVASRTVAFGYRLGLSKAGFNYDPDAVKNALFPDVSDESTRPRKRLRLSDSNGVQADIDDDLPTEFGTSACKKVASIIIETFVETFLIAPHVDTDPKDKENVNGDADDYLPPLRYTISLVRIPELVSTRDPEPISSHVKTVPSGLENGAPKADTEPDAESLSKSTDSGNQHKETLPGASGISSANANTAQSAAAVSGSSSEPPVPETNGAAVEDSAESTAASSSVHVPASAPEPTLAEAVSSPSPMDITPPEPATSVPEAVEERNSEHTAAKPTSNGLRKPEPSKTASTLEVLQRDICQDDLRFDADGIAILSDQLENGMRKGWKIEARTWRWATGGLTVA